MLYWMKRTRHLRDVFHNITDFLICPGFTKKITVCGNCETRANFSTFINLIYNMIKETSLRDAQKITSSLWYTKFTLNVNLNRESDDFESFMRTMDKNKNPSNLEWCRLDVAFFPPIYNLSFKSTSRELVLSFCHGAKCTAKKSTGKKPEAWQRVCY